VSWLLAFLRYPVEHDWRAAHNYARTYLAKRKLDRLVRKRRQSFDCEQYRRRREAALRGLGRAA
jgi:hypothetical protein